MGTHLAKKQKLNDPKKNHDSTCLTIVAVDPFTVEYFFKPFAHFWRYMCYVYLCVSVCVCKLNINESTYGCLPSRQVQMFLPFRLTKHLKHGQYGQPVWNRLTISTISFYVCVRVCVCMCMWMWVRTYVCAYTHTQTYTYIRTHTYTVTHVHTHIHKHTQTYTHTHTHTYMCMYVSLCVYVCVRVGLTISTISFCACVYVCVYVCVYAYIHTHTYTYKYIHIQSHTWTAQLHTWKHTHTQ